MKNLRYLIFALIPLFSAIGRCASIDGNIDSYMFLTDKSQGTFSVNVGTYSLTSGAIVGASYTAKFVVGVDTVSVSGIVSIAPRTSLPSSAQVNTAILNDLKNLKAQGVITRRTADEAAKRTQGALSGNTLAGVAGSAVTVP